MGGCDGLLGADDGAFDGDDVGAELGAAIVAIGMLVGIGRFKNMST